MITYLERNLGSISGIVARSKVQPTPDKDKLRITAELLRVSIPADVDINVQLNFVVAPFKQHLRKRQKCFIRK